MRAYKNELEQFIIEICLQPLIEQTNVFLASHPECLKSAFSDDSAVSHAQIEGIASIYVVSAAIDEDTLSLKIMAKCRFAEPHSEIIMLTISFDATITDRLDSIIVLAVSYGEDKTDLKIDEGTFVSGNLVPQINPSDLDAEAEAFLSRYYPEALEEALPLPITDIAENLLHLRLVQGKCITKNLSIFGEICFSEGSVNL